MNKKELIKAVSIDTGIAQTDIRNIFDSILIHISEELKEGYKIDIKDFGSFNKETRRQRKGRNPQTGESITIPEKQVVKFKPYKNILNYKWL